MEKEKPSVYLAGKCECLATVIDFFAANSGSYRRTVKDKRVVFLSQIDFWDWEMDELIYSVESFNERSKAWESCATLRDCLDNANIPVDPAIIYKIQTDRGMNAEYVSKNKVVPPIESLNYVIGKWNKLLKICEDTLFLDRKEIMSLAEMGRKFLPNLDKYRKVER